MTKSQDGIYILAEKIQAAPACAGVYRMLNDKAQVLYVGKAKNLKKRLTSYTQSERLSSRIRKMVFETRDVLWVECASETEALLLEISLIKSLKPRYNVMFRDDTSYPSILITDEETPRITHHRGAQRIKGHYFGPYPNVDAMYQTIDLMEKSFLLRTCKDSVFKNRTRPCLKYHIKRCSAPCVAKISAPDYQDLVHQSLLFLQGKTKDVQVEIEKGMLQASEEMRFEEAAMARDRLRAITQVLATQSAFVQSLKNADVLALDIQGRVGCVQLFSYRSSQHIGNAHFILKQVEGLSEGEILSQFMAQYYQKRETPRFILTSHDVADMEVLSSYFSEKQGQKIEILTPKRGEKKDIVDAALKNARNTLTRQMRESSSWQSQMHAFADILGVDHSIERVETFDISNISGKNAVASLVVAGAEGMLKSDYRKFSIKLKDTPDDYAMMHEVLMRRYSKILKSQGETTTDEEPLNWPDVIMVDGGKGHLNVLIDVFKKLDLLDDPACPILCSIAKGEERDKGLETIFRAHFKGSELVKVEELPVAYNSPLIFVLQQIRDESHRFAIGFHRQKRSKNTFKSALDDIAGVGAKRKKALLLAFGSVEGIRSASVTDVAKVQGVSLELAKTIKDQLL